MSNMLPEGGEVMRRVACGDVCVPAPLPAPAPPAPATHKHRSENKELLRQQLLSAKERHSTDQHEAPRAKPPRCRQRNRWKLKFHHQALPQQYLDHYEQSLQKASAARASKQPAKVKHKPEPDHDAVTGDTFNAWAQRLAGASDETSPSGQHAQSVSTATRSSRGEERRRKGPAITPSKIVTYDDLPYMGEMTLNNSKPRRGRKPKKADICHLIYENYGTVVPGQPPPAPDGRSARPTMCPPLGLTDNPAPSAPKTDLQNKIISSLLGRKLCQESRRRMESAPPSFGSPDEPMPAAPVTVAGPLHSDDEPLNLCIRDLRDLKLQIQKKFGNIYTSLPDVKTEPDELEAAGVEQPNAISVIQRTPTASSSPDLSHRIASASPALSEPARSTVSSEGEARVPGVYWPDAGLYVHPIALQTQLLYYQRLAAAGRLPFPGAEPSSPGDSVSTASTPSPATDEPGTKLVLKQISELLDPKIASRPDEARSGPDGGKMKRASPNPAQGPAKRKRSAIFIPPVPPRTSSTTPTTEVSICKFKFTGGSKPSLQEKKMLSVDSGGNFRYYSGTGNKGNKGYEYLHRDSNQGRAEAAASAGRAEAPPSAPAPRTEETSKRRRKSRKSLEREKLEQTFKEKGFLIQTQQLQSAEGATYCKFRQLRKFTRYLFRSWKDYLPGELADPPRPAPAPPSPPRLGLTLHTKELN